MAAALLLLMAFAAVFTRSIQGHTITCASTICNVTDATLNSTKGQLFVCAASVDVCLFECDTKCGNLTIQSFARHTMVNCVSPHSCSGVRLICDDASVNVTVCDRNLPQATISTTANLPPSDDTDDSQSFMQSLLQDGSSRNWVFIVGGICAVVLMFCIVGVCCMYRAKRSHGAHKKREADSVAKHVTMNVIPATPDDDDDDDEEEEDPKQLTKPRSASYMIRRYLTAQNIDTVDDDHTSHEQTDLASSVNMFSAAVHKQLTLSRSKQRSVFSAGTALEEADSDHDDDDRENDEPELPSRAQQKSTFDATLDDVVTANTSLMDDCVRELALSLSRRETPAASTTTNGNSNHAHASQQEASQATKTATAAVNDINSEKQKIYGFRGVNNTVLETAHTSEEFIPPAPEVVFPTLKVTFDRKLHNGQHSQQLMMDQIVHEIVKKEAQFTAK